MRLFLWFSNTCVVVEQLVKFFVCLMSLLFLKRAKAKRCSIFKGTFLGITQCTKIAKKSHFLWNSELTKHNWAHFFTLIWCLKKCDLCENWYFENEFFATYVIFVKDVIFCEKLFRFQKCNFWKKKKGFWNVILVKNEIMKMWFFVKN